MVKDTTNAAGPTNEQQHTYYSYVYLLRGKKIIMEIDIHLLNIYRKTSHIEVDKRIKNRLHLFLVSQD